MARAPPLRDAVALTETLLLGNWMRKPPPVLGSASSQQPLPMSQTR